MSEPLFRSAQGGLIPPRIGELRLFGGLLGFAVLFWTLVAHCAGRWDSCADHLRDLTGEPGSEGLLLTFLLVFSGTCFVFAVLLPRALTPCTGPRGSLARFFIGWSVGSHWRCCSCLPSRRWACSAARCVRIHCAYAGTLPREAIGWTGMTTARSAIGFEIPSED